MTLLNIGRLERSINDLLDISKIEAGKVELFKERLDLESVVDHVLQGFSLQARDKGLELKTFFSSPEIEVCADSDKLIQIFTNLIGNAFKFTHSGYIELGCEIQDNSILFIISNREKIKITD
jgi:signal transduction histidine kinase